MARLTPILVVSVLAGMLASAVAEPAGKQAPARTKQPPAKTKQPPALFQSLAKSVTQAGFHLNTRDPAGWYEASICHRHPKVAACTALDESWASSIVADKGDGVVQELWVFVYSNSAAAATALASLEKDFDYGPFSKHPYQLYACGRHVFATEGRFRWHTAGKQLNAHVKSFLAKHCPQKK